MAIVNSLRRRDLPRRPSARWPSGWNLDTTGGWSREPCLYVLIPRFRDERRTNAEEILKEIYSKATLFAAELDFWRRNRWGQAAPGRAENNTYSVFRKCVEVALLPPSDPGPGGRQRSPH